MSVASFDEQFLLTSKEFAESKSYWLQQLAPLSSSEDVGLFNTWNITDNRDILLYKLDKTVAGKVLSLCKGQELSVYIYMVTACCVLINKYTGAQYITICAPLFDKQQHPHAPHQQQYLPLLCNINPEKTFKELLVSIGEVVLHAAGNQHYPLTGIYQELDIDEKRFDMMLSCDQLHGSHPKKKNESPFLIDLDIQNAEISFRVSCAVQTTFSIDGFITHLKAVITESLSHLSVPVATISLLSASERAFLLQERNDTFVDTGDDRTMADLFAESVARDAAATAVVCGGESLSYGELDKQSNRVARYLRKKGVMEDDLVAVCLDRSLDMIVSLLGIIKAGAAYVPVDPAYPSSRIDYILSDTKAKIVLSSYAYADNFRAHNDVEVLDMNNAAVWLEDCTDEPVETNLHPGHLAYVIYTSGSTGRPKGVMNEHRGVVNRLLWTQSYFGLTPADAVLQKTTYCFDVSVWELFWPLIAGCRLVFAAPGGQQDPYYLKQLIKSAQITTIHFVPSMLGVFCDSVDEGEVFPLRRVLCSGEALKSAHVKQFRDKLGDIGLHNLYGPTEAAIDVSCWTVPLLPALPAIVPIGKPVWNTSLYILDDQLNVLPAGASGELLIGGVQVARGYLNQPELSAAKFIDNPYAAGRLYHTGDLARWLPDGNIEYLGRRDDQVKVRGFRVELGEVERMLQQAPGIKQAVVLVNNDAAGSKILAGYIVTSDEFSKEIVNGYLQNKLPEYMIPSVLFTVKEMPLTLNGKVDKKRLLKEQELTVSEYVAPEHEFEKVLASIWEGLLNISRIGVHDKFFEIGGHSLLAMRVIAAVRKQLNKEISVRDIFDHPTIASLCQKMLTDDNGNEVIPPIQYYAGRDTAALSFSQERIWFIDQLNGSREYHMPYVLKLNGEVNIPLFETAVRMIVERHGALRTVIRDHDGRAYQTLLPAEDWKLGVAQAAEVIAGYGTLDNYIDTLVDAPFNLATDMPFRLHLITVAPGVYILVVVLHHIASDGWSMGILVKETTAAYHSLLAGEMPVFNALPVRYIDYAIWQRAYLTKEVMAAKLEYWKGQLKDLPVMELPADYPRPATQSVKGKGMNAMLGREVLVALQEVSGKEGATLFMILLAAFKVLLYRFSGQQDIVIGSPVANRQQQETEGMIGFFVNTLVLRNKINGNLSFKEFLREVTQSTLQAFEHQDVQLEKIVDELELPRDLSRNPLFQIMFALQNTPEGSKLDLPGVASHSEGSNVIRSKYDLSLDVVSFSDGLDIALTYCSDLYREETMERMFSSYLRLLTSITENPAQRISSLCRLTSAESYLLLDAYNNTDEVYTSNETILELFRAQVKNTPAHTAALHGTTTRSYQELETASNQLAHYLLSKGIKEGMLVPVFVERGLDMLTAVLGILKAGAVYVPIDVKYPDERVTYILKDSNAAFVVCSGTVRERLTSSSLNIIDLQQSTAAISNCPVEAPVVMLKSTDLAYIIYTSGSTGHPKGVMIEHGNVYHFIKWCLREFSGDDFKMVYAVTSLCFDLSVFELFYSLSAGKTIRVLDDALEIPTYLSTDREVLINTVPGVIQGLVDSQVDLGHVTCINMAGEAIQANLLAELDLKRMKVRNLYGPSEDTTYTTVFHLQPGEAPLIGQPISNTKIYIVNNDLELCVPGTPGELCIAGAGLARGYLNDAALTA
ncbi:MAG: amino acid adenylation domain-containing protein, partial [Chitinophaga sp.]|uniref:non-ribosomal peptide synthetase n=1 Tax=Chitinophaga sp. TaxID=1869181 RepID=UPI001B092516